MLGLYTTSISHILDDLAKDFDKVPQSLGNSTFTGAEGNRAINVSLSKGNSENTTLPHSSSRGCEAAFRFLEWQNNAAWRYGALPTKPP